MIIWVDPTEWKTSPTICNCQTIIEATNAIQNIEWNNKEAYDNNYEVIEYIDISRKLDYTKLTNWIAATGRHYEVRTHV